MSSVQVLLATHNGANYLEQLIASILDQFEIDELSILASDDKSTDGTKKILSDFGITTLDGPAKGAAANFRNLINNAGGHDFYAFADQDDLWFPNKISSAISKLESIQNPAIYVGSTIDTNGKIHTPEPYTFPESLMSNQIQGCTIVLNKKFFLLLKESLPASFIMHDWWIYNLAQCVGEVILDETPCMIYRLHGENLIGTDSQFLEFLRLLAKLKSREHFIEVSNQARSFLQLPTRNAKILEIESWVRAMEGNLFTRIKYLHKVKLDFHSIKKKVFFSFLIFIGMFRPSIIAPGASS